MRELIDQYFKHCEEDLRLHESTIKAYRRGIDCAIEFFDKHLDANWSFTDIDKNILRQYIRENTDSEKGMNRSKIRPVSRLFSYLHFESVIDVNPFDKVRIKFKKSKCVPKALSRDELQTILYLAYKELDKAREKSIKSYMETLAKVVVFELLISTGARISEILEIKRKQINLETRVLTIIGKGDKERRVSLTNLDVVDILTYYLNIQSEFKVEERIFIDGEFCNINQKKMDYQLKKHTRHLDKNVTLHMFRHSFASILVNQDVDLIVIKEILGHENIKTTEVYLHNDQEKQKQVLQTSNPREKLNPHKVLIKKRLSELENEKM